MRPSTVLAALIAGLLLLAVGGCASSGSEATQPSLATRAAELQEDHGEAAEELKEKLKQELGAGGESSEELLEKFKQNPESNEEQSEEQPNGREAEQEGESSEGEAQGQGSGQAEQT